MIVSPFWWQLTNVPPPHTHPDKVFSQTCVFIVRKTNSFDFDFDCHMSVHTSSKLFLNYFIHHDKFLEFYKFKMSWQNDSNHWMEKCCLFFTVEHSTWNQFYPPHPPHPHPPHPLKIRNWKFFFSLNFIIIVLNSPKILLKKVLK